MASDDDGITANSIVVDGFMVHSACVGNLTAKEFQERNRFTQDSLGWLLQSLVIHDKLLVGPDVIGPIKTAEHQMRRTRTPILTELFHDALVEKATLPIDAGSRTAQEYAALKQRYAALRNPKTRYEDALTDLVQAGAYQSDAEDVQAHMQSMNPALHAILTDHTRVRARMYVREARLRKLPYVPNPTRRSLFGEPAFQDAITRDGMDDIAIGDTIASDIIKDLISSVRTPLVEALKQWSVISNRLQLDAPPFTQFILNESRSAGIFKTARDIRASKEAKDFRRLCGEVQQALAAPQESGKLLPELLKELEKARDSALHQLRLKPGVSKDIDVKFSVLVMSIGTKVEAPDKHLRFSRPAHAFLYDVVTSFGRR